jgi:hypothetical protein
MALYIFEAQNQRLTTIPPHMKVAVIGSRTFNDYTLLKKTLDDIPGLSVIISGGAKGADSLAEQWAQEKGIETMVFKPDWAKYGRGAGVVRNRLIIEDCDCCIAFWDGVSKGTKSSIDHCNKLNKKITVHIFC